MTTHTVKSWTHLFQPIVEGRKTHDLRDLNDRDYKVGDYLNLCEFDPATGEFTGHEAVVKITYITSNRTPCAFSSAVLSNGFGILSIKLLAEDVA